MSIGMFLDGAYVWKAFGEKLNYLKLREFVEERIGEEIDEGYFFNADDDPSRTQGLHNSLAYPPPHGPGLRVKIYWLSRKQLWWPKHLGGHAVVHPNDPSLQYEFTQQKAVDVGLVFHLIRSFSKRNWKTLVLGAGDGDFHEPVQYLVETENVDLYLIGSMSTISDRLRPYAREIFEIDLDPLHEQLRLETEYTPA